MRVPNVTIVVVVGLMKKEVEMKVVRPEVDTNSVDVGWMVVVPGTSLVTVVMFGVMLTTRLVVMTTTEMEVTVVVKTPVVTIVLAIVLVPPSMTTSLVSMMTLVNTDVDVTEVVVVVDVLAGTVRVDDVVRVVLERDVETRAPVMTVLVEVK